MSSFALCNEKDDLIHFQLCNLLSGFISLAKLFQNTDAGIIIMDKIIYCA